MVVSLIISVIGLFSYKNMDKKIYFTYDEQIETLKTKYNIIISNDKIIEKNILKIFSFSLVDDYIECFSDAQLRQMRLEDFLIISVFDKQFQKILFLHSIYVENILKNKISNFIVKNNGYNVDNYIKKSRFKYSQQKLEKIDKILEKIKEIISKNKNLKFYELFKNISFNDTIDFFSFLTRKEKLEIISEYQLFKEIKIEDEKESNEKIELFKNMISIIRRFRNMVAHNKKIIGTYLKDVNVNLIRLIKIDKFNILNFKNIKINNKKRKTDIFVMILSFLFLAPSDYIIILLFSDLMVFFTNNEEVIQWVLFYLKALNFPDDFVTKITKIYNKHLNKLKEKSITHSF